MLTITDNAGAHLKNVLESSEAGADAAVRLVVEEGGLAVTLDTQNPEDAAFEHDGKTILVLAPDLAEALDERTLDAQPSEKGGMALSLM